MNYIAKLSKAFENKVLENQHAVNPSVVVEEHEGVKPVSYMAFNNLKTVINDATELLSILNDEDDLPQWVDEMLAMSKGNLSKALDYVRSEKTETESLLEDEEEGLVAEAQFRGFLSSVKDVFNKPKTNVESKLIEIDEELRNLFLSHGALNTSLDKDLSFARQAIDENNFKKARKHLTDFNNALLAMSRRANDFINYSKMPEKQAGFFDFLKRKEVGPTRTGTDQLLFEQFSKLTDAGSETLRALKSIFQMLDRYRSEKNVLGYANILESLKNEQRLFSQKFEMAKQEYFIYLDESGQEQVGRTLREMKQDLYQPKEDKYVGVGSFETSPASIKALQFNQPVGQDEISPWIEQQKRLLSPTSEEVSIKKTDECPCGSMLPWGSCHGTDIDSINQIMNDKNISYQDAEIEYHKKINKAVRDNERRRAEKEEKERDKRRKEYLRLLKMFEAKLPESESKTA